MGSLDLPLALDDVKGAISQTSSSKTPGTNGIPAGLVTHEAFHSILTSIWEEEDMPKDFRDATIVSFFKSKGSKADHGNYWGILLLSTAKRVLAHVILNCLVTAY